MHYNTQIKSRSGVFRKESIELLTASDRHMLLPLKETPSFVQVSVFHSKYPFTDFSNKCLLTLFYHNLSCVIDLVFLYPRGVESHLVG